MTVRTPIKITAGHDVQVMTAGELTQMQDFILYLYGVSPTVSISVVGSGGTLNGVSATMSDTRLLAGGYQTRVDRFPLETETAEPYSTTVNYSKMQDARENHAVPADTNNVRFPAYKDEDNNIRAMTQEDFLDTFIRPSISTITDGSDRGGTYRIHTASSLSGHTLVSATPIFSDSRADTTLYTAAGIPETQDQSTTISNYYLMVTNAIAKPTLPIPAFVRTDGNIQKYDTTDFENLLDDGMEYVTTNDTGYKINYTLNGAGNNRGEMIIDTILNGSGDYQTLYVNTDDYRAQEFPDGTPTTASSYYLRITQT